MRKEMGVTMGERKIYIDNTKAFAIFLVVIGHIALRITNDTHDFCGILSYYIYCFHMPLFFILSGMSFAISQEKYRKKSNICYIMTYCIDFAWSIFLFNGIYFCLFPSSFTEVYENKGLIGILLAGAARYWYIVVLCLIYVCTIFLKKVSINIVTALLSISFLCGIIHMEVAKFFLYLALFVFGICIKEKTFKMRGGGIHGIIFLLLSTIWYFISGGGLLMDVYSKTVLGFSASLFFIDWFSKHTKRNECTIFSVIGENTLIIYLTHSGLLDIIENRQILDNVSSSLTRFLIMFIIICVVNAVLILILNRYKKVKYLLLKPSKLMRN